MTLRDWLIGAVERLESAGIEASQMDAQLLAAHVLQKDRSWVLANPGHEVTETAMLDSVLARREAREPLAYILGVREFYGRPFRVRHGVLIPRPETETLIEELLSRIPKGERRTILDWGCGSGCLAITIKLERPDCDVSGLDISETAIQTSMENSRRLGAEVDWVESDGFALVAGRSFDFIVANPPYVADQERLAPEIAQHEPKQAIFAGPTGLEAYRLLATEAAEHLGQGGLLALEVGHEQAPAVREVFQKWNFEGSRRDLGGVERCLVFSPNV